MSKNAPCVVHQDDCPVEGWDAPGRGGLRWWTLLSADRTPSSGLTVGVAELDADPAAAPILHRHAQPEVYHILSGEGTVFIDGRAYAVRAGSTVYIPGDAEHAAINTGAEPLRLFYVFATDAIGDVHYRFSQTP